MNILKVHDLFEYQVSSIMWDFDHNSLPTALNSLFIKSKNIHSHSTRFANADKVLVNKVNTHKYGLMSFRIIGASTLNKLKDHDFYNNSRTKNIFLSYLKKILISKYE